MDSYNTGSGRGTFQCLRSTTSLLPATPQASWQNPFSFATKRPPTQHCIPFRYTHGMGARRSRTAHCCARGSQIMARKIHAVPGTEVFECRKDGVRRLSQSCAPQEKYSLLFFPQLSPRIGECTGNCYCL